MSFISEGSKGQVYAPGYFLAHEECERKTREIPQSMATTADNGTKYVKMGTVFPANDATAEGIVYEDVDVTTGNMPGSVVTKGVVYEDRLPITDMSYDAATVTSADNPTTEGWYEKDDDEYVESTDTVASKEKTYYESDGQETPTYTAVDDVEYGDDPKALGLYERSGESPDYVYTLSTDTQADGAKTYYEVTGVIRISSNAKTALAALGFTFVQESTVERPY